MAPLPPMDFRDSMWHRRRAIPCSGRKVFNLRLGPGMAFFGLALLAIQATSRREPAPLQRRVNHV